jgi:hypothetical protein
VDNVDILRNAFNTTQNILQNGIDGIRVIVLYCPEIPIPPIHRCVVYIWLPCADRDPLGARPL